MSLAFFFACLATLPAGAWASRVSAEDSQEAPWKKSAALGALLGGAQLSDVAGFTLQKSGGRAGVRLATAKEDDYAKMQAKLVDIFGGAGKVDEESYGKLMTGLRRNADVDGNFVHELEERLSRAHGKRETHADDGHGMVVDTLEVPSEGADSGGFSIVRYPPRENQTSAWASGMWRFLSGVERSRSLHSTGLFPRYVAQSHTAEEFVLDSKGELLLMREQYFGTLREVMRMRTFEYEERLEVFLEVLRVVQRLHGLGIPHTSSFTPDAVILREDLIGTVQGNILLIPDVILAESVSSEDELWASDMEQLGTLLKFLFQDEFDQRMQKSTNVLLAFGSAMEGGAFSGGRNAALEFVHLVEGLSSGMDTLDLLRKKLTYERWEADAAIAADMQHSAS